MFLQRKNKAPATKAARTRAIMLEEVRALNRMPFDKSEIGVISRGSAGIVHRPSVTYRIEDGLCHMVAEALHMEFLVVKSRRPSKFFPSSRPRYTVMMGFERGEAWEEGPVVRSPRAVAFVFQSMDKVDRWMDQEYGKKRDGAVGDSE